MQNVLINNLALSDCIMGIAMLMLSSADFYYSEYFPTFSEGWIKGKLCKVIATLSTLSTEASVCLITLIGFDRYLGISYPLGAHKGLGSTRMKICVCMSWFLSVIVSVVPIILDHYFSGFFEISEVCVGIPMVKRVVTTQKPASFQFTINYVDGEYVQLKNVSRVLERWYPSGTSDGIEDAFKRFFGYTDFKSYQGYSFGFWRLKNYQISHNIEYTIAEISGHKLASLISMIIFIGFNLVCFIALAVLYMQIFRLARSSAQSVQSSAKSNEIRMALKMSALVLTDFVCWIPLAFVCVLVQCGVVTIGPDMYAWTVGLILPINSAINPFLYTLATLIAEKLEDKRRDVTRQTVSSYI